MHQPSQADALSAASLGIMPQGPPGIPDALAALPPQHSQQTMGSFHDMPQGGGMQMPPANEPVAANELGGSPFSSLF